MPPTIDASLPDIKIKINSIAEICHPASLPETEKFFAKQIIDNLDDSFGKVEENNSI